MGAYADACDACLPAVTLHYSLESILGQRMTTTSKKYLVVLGDSWLRTIAIEVLPDCFLYLGSDGHQPFLTSFTPYLKQATVKVNTGEPQTSKLTAADKVSIMV